MSNRKFLTLAQSSLTAKLSKPIFHKKSQIYYEVPIKIYGYNTYSLAISPCSTILATGSDFVKIYQIIDMREIVLGKHLERIRSVTFSPDGKWITSGSNDKKVKIRNVDKKCEEFSFKNHKSYVLSVVFV